MYLYCSVKYIQKVSDFLLFTNIYLGICMIGLYFAFSMKPIGEVGRFDFLLFVFCSTVSVYSLLRLMNVSRIQDTPLKNISWAAQHLVLANRVMYIAAGGAVLTFLFLNNQEQMVVILLGVVWILYNASIFSRGRVKYDLRGIWFLKPLIVGFIITGIVSWVPFQDSSPYSLATFFCTATILFCFVSALVVIFEIKDREVDSSFKTATITTRLGIAKTKVVAIVLLALSIAFSIVLHRSLSLIQNIAFVLPILVLIFFVIFFINAKTKEYVYWIVIDGWMIILGIVWYVLNNRIIEL